MYPLNCRFFADFSRHSLRIYYSTTDYFSIILLFKFINILYVQKVTRSDVIRSLFYTLIIYTFRRYTLSFIRFDVIHSDVLQFVFIRSDVVRSVRIRIEFISSVVESTELFSSIMW